MNRPPLHSRIRFDNGREAEVVEHTARGFRYKGEPHPWVPRWGMSFTGEGEIYTDTPEYELMQAQSKPYFTVLSEFSVFMTGSAPIPLSTWKTLQSDFSI